MNIPYGQNQVTATAVRPEPDSEWIATRLKTIGHQLKNNFGNQILDAVVFVAIDSCFDYLEDPGATAQFSFCNTVLTEFYQELNLEERDDQIIKEIFDTQWYDQISQGKAA